MTNDSIRFVRFCTYDYFLNKLKKTESHSCAEMTRSLSLLVSPRVTTPFLFLNRTVRCVCVCVCVCVRIPSFSHSLAYTNR